MVRLIQNEYSVFLPSLDNPSSFFLIGVVGEGSIKVVGEG